MSRGNLHTRFTIELRRQYYWKRIRAGKMRADDAEKRIALMEAIVKRLTTTAAI
jgi:hypothetical protein